MSKVLKTAALVVGAVALVATGISAVAAATAAAGTVASAFGVAATTFTSIGALAGVAAGVLSLGASLTAKKPTAFATGSQTKFSADPDAGIPLVLGRTGTAGNIVARFGYDTADPGANDRQSFVSVLSLGPSQAIEGMTVDRVATSFSGAGAAIGAFAGFMWMTAQLGALPEAAALGFGTGAGTPPGWTAAHKLSGLTAATWTLRFDTHAALYQAGVPAPMWTVKGALAYDPRKDSTYPGGSGAHRMADPADRAAYDAAVATWEWTQNPYLLGLRYVHGFWQRDTTDATSQWTRVMGMGAPAPSIDTAAFVDGANVADANGWTCGGVLFSGDPKWDRLKAILQAGMGEPLALGAKISCLVNAPKVSLATITDADLRGAASCAATQPRRDRINTITPKYRLEANNWELLAGAPIGVAAYVAADRGKRSKVQECPFIQSTAQAATAVRYDIENAREFGPVTLPLGLAWMGYKPGDCVTVTVGEIGLTAQPVLLLTRSLEPVSGLVTLVGRSETNAKHAFALGQTAVAPPTPAITATTTPALLTMIGDAATTAAWPNVTNPTGTRPADNATRNDDGTNDIPGPTDPATWILSNGALINYDTGRARAQLYTPAALVKWGVPMACNGGETRFVRYWLKNDGGGPGDSCNSSYIWWDGAGTATAVNLADRSARTLPQAGGGIAVEFSFVLPPTAVRYQLYLERPTGTVGTNSFFAEFPYSGRAQPGATVGATWGVNVFGSNLPANNATADLTLFGSGANPPVITSNSAKGAVAGWGGFVASTNGVTGPARVRFRLTGDNTRAGFSTANNVGTAGSTYTYLTYVVIVQGGVYYAVRGASVVATLSGASAATVFEISYDGISKYSFIQGGTVVWTETDTTVPAILYAAASLQDTGSSVEQFGFAPYAPLDPATGRIVDPRGLPPISAMNLGYKYKGTPTYSAAAGTPATATISFGAAQLLGGSTAISYNAMSVGVTGTNGTSSTFQLYVEEPNPTAFGGAKTLVATTTGDDIYSGTNRVWLGSVVVAFPAAGGGSGSGGGGGGGGGTGGNPIP